MDNETQLSAHIRHLLLDYVRCHLTIDYVQYTRSAVAELVSLERVPAHDPVSLTLPSDPFTAMFSLFKLGDLSPYQEKITVSQAARLLLKHIISLPKGQPRSERLSWSEDPWDQREDDAFYNVEPVLTRRAVRETPVLGKTSGVQRSKGMQKVNPTSYSSLMTTYPTVLVTINVPPVHEPVVNLDQVLDVTYHLKASEHTAVRALLKSTSTLCRPRALSPNANKNDYRRMYLPASFDFNQPRSITPPPDSPPLVPIFARTIPLHCEKGPSVTNACRGLRRPLLRSMEEIPECIGASGMPQVGTDDEGVAAASESLSRENMVIVDGWQTYATSSPSTICSGDDDEIDELIDMFPSSPDTEVSGAFNLMQDIEDSKIEEVQIPRNRRIGGNLGQRKGTMVDKALKAGGLSTFLTPLLGSSFDSENIHTQGLHPLLQEKLAPIFTHAPSGSSGGTKIPQPLEQPVESPSVVRNRNQMEADVDSLCGQASASSILALETPTDATKEEEEERNCIRGLYQDLSGPGVVRLGPPLPRICVDPKALIRDERLFDNDDDMETKGDQKDIDKERAMMLRLMPVPLLPAPNAGARAPVKSYLEYLVEPGTGATKGNKDILPPVRFLKGVKGIAPLRVELSWIPFTRTNPIPAHARILGNDLFQEMNGGEALEREVHALLSRVCADPEPGNQLDGCGFNDEWRWRVVGGRDFEVMKGSHEFSPDMEKCDIILTRAERRALLAREGGKMAMEQEEHAKSVNDDRNQVSPDNKGFEVHTSNAGKTLHARDENEYRPAKRVRLSIEDSGIGMMSEPAIWDGRLFGFAGYPQDVLDDQNAEVEDTKDMLCGILTDGDEMLTESSHGCYEDHNKENDPPPQCVERTNHDFYVAGQEPEDWNNDYGEDGEGSFEPLSLSYDSQPYQAFAARYRQTDTEDTQSHEDSDIFRGQQEEFLYAGVDIIQEPQEQHTPTWNSPRYVLGDLVKLDEGRYDTTMNGDADYSNIRTAEDLADQLEETSSRGTKHPILGLAAHALGISEFTRLRAKKLASETTTLAPLILYNQTPPKADSSAPPGANQQQNRNETDTLTTPPQELYDSKTLRLPSPWTTPINVHKYMASLELLQKQVLVKTLASQEFLVELAERESLDGADLIIDPHTAVIFTPLLSLPALNKRILITLSAQTWRYRRVLIVFEAYPSSRSYRSASRLRQKQGLVGIEPELHAYTPPIVKAIKRFRRDLDIAEGCGKKAAGCEVWSAFADSVGEAAMYTRLFGEEAERADCTGGAMWGSREWLDIDMSEDEENLASLAGMNRFSASMVLCQVTLQEFLDLRPEQRITMISPFIGPEATNMLNADLGHRIRTIESSEVDMLQYSGMDIDASVERSD